VMSAGPATWNSSSLDPTFDWQPLCLTLPSPVPVLDPQTGAPIAGVFQAKDKYILKTDGSLWSFGNGGNNFVNTIGLQPVDPTDLYQSTYMSIGMLPGRVEIEGNDKNGILSGREIVEINTCGPDLGIGSAGLARCKDGSLWTWGNMYDSEHLPDGDF